MLIGQYFASFERSIFKCAPIFWLFFSIFLFRSPTVPTFYSICIKIGLLFCGVGDIFLVYDSEGYLIPGIITFAIGHIFYILACGFSPFGLGYFVPFALYLIVFVNIFYPYLRGILIIAVPIYSTVISCMMWRALVAASENSSLSLALGAILFGISDSLLSTNMFIKNLPFANYSVMITYYLGQYFFAISTVLTAEKSKTS